MGFLPQIGLRHKYKHVCGSLPSHLQAQLPKRKNKRVDICLLNLVKFIRDKTYERTIKLTKGKLTVRIREIQNRHATARVMKTIVLPVKDGHGWEVASEDGNHVYQVQKINEHCPESHCSLKCHSCKETCLHTFSCTCIDSLMHGTICKHIHKLRYP